MAAANPIQLGDNMLRMAFPRLSGRLNGSDCLREEGRKAPAYRSVPVDSTSSESLPRDFHVPSPIQLVVSSLLQRSAIWLSIRGKKSSLESGIREDTDGVHH